MRAAADAFASEFDPSEIELVSFGGQPYWLAYRRPAPVEVENWHSMSAFDFIAPTLDHEHRLVDASNPYSGTYERLPDEAMHAAARLAMPDASITESVWLDSYDDYYYPRQTSFDLGLPQSVRSLPVLRVKFDDPERTWLYLDPAYAQFVKFESTDRLNRWTYYGLHAFDFVFSRRPFWDVLVLTLLIGGLVLSSTTLLPMVRRLHRHVARIRARVL